MSMKNIVYYTTHRMDYLHNDKIGYNTLLQIINILCHTLLYETITVTRCHGRKMILVGLGKTYVYNKRGDNKQIKQNADEKHV